MVTSILEKIFGPFKLYGSLQNIVVTMRKNFLILQQVAAHQNFPRQSLGFLNPRTGTNPWTELEYVSTPQKIGWVACLNMADRKNISQEIKMDQSESFLPENFL